MNNLLVILTSFVYFVSFPDKTGSEQICLSPRAQAQRVQWNIPIDSLDYEVSPIYLDSLRNRGLEILHTSRWMNGATVKTNSSQLVAQLSGLSWVSAVEMTRDNSSARYYAPTYSVNREVNERLTRGNPGKVTDQQLALFNLTPLHEMGFNGQGILMCVCDGAFYKTNTISCFDSVRNQILGDFDFTDDQGTIYSDYSGDHGTMCLSLIAGIQSNYHGAATGADYYLMRSEESAHESPKEMDNWVAAVEKCDSLGVNVMSTSLGYFAFDNRSWDLQYSDMNGINTRSSRAATIAARKGMLLAIAMGNEGDDPQHYLSTPADGDSILSVGAVGVDSVIASFSSWGPTYDGRFKPEACAVGYQAYIIDPSGYCYPGNGTSFACPLLAGMAASLWSALPNLDAQSIRRLIMESCDRYIHPSGQYGYGIPNAYVAYTKGLTTDMIPTISNIENNGYTEKRIQEGRIFIIRNGVKYDVLGNRID